MNIVERAISIVAPFDCLICGKEGRIICQTCSLEAFGELPSRCFLCKSATENFATCKKCQAKTRLKHVWVSTEYIALAKKLVKAFKFERAQSAAVTVAEFMSESLPYLEDYLIIPVPTASVRIRARGYDHARLLAKRLAKHTGLPYLNSMNRLGQTRQVGARRATRLKQLDGAFRIKNQDLVKGQQILLVDDVLTTGTTLSEAAKSLKKSGAREVNAVVFAQTK